MLIKTLFNSHRRQFTPVPSPSQHSPRNLCQWLIEPSEVMGVEIATTLHDFESEIEHVFVIKGCFFVGGGDAPLLLLTGFLPIESGSGFTDSSYYQKIVQNPRQELWRYLYHEITRL